MHPASPELVAMRVRLLPAGPWRIGTDSGDRDRVDRIYHSDSVYSAVAGAMARLGMLEAWLDATARTQPPAVRFSSCFPYRNETLFAVPPRHVWPPPASAKVRWKGARFVPLSAIETVLSGRQLDDQEWTVDGPSECLVQAGGPGPFLASVRSSAAVDRGGSSVVPHSTACLEFTPGSGLWMIVAFSDEAARERWRGLVEMALRLLADSGFGGERSRGWGRSEMPEIVDGALPDLFNKSGNGAGETGHWMLSLFHPAESDSIDWQRGNYSLITRGGRVESNAGWGHPKKQASMIAEGSVIVAASEPRGTAANVAPDDFPHPVYRAGFAVSVLVPLSVTARPLS